MPQRKHPGFYWECLECGNSFSGHCDSEELIDHYLSEHPDSEEVLQMSDISDIFTKRVSHGIRAKNKRNSRHP